MSRVLGHKVFSSDWYICLIPVYQVFKVVKHLHKDSLPFVMY